MMTRKIPRKSETVPPQEFAQPERSWRPLHAAKFCFFPHYAGPGHPWRREMQAFVRGLDPKYRMLAMHAVDDSVLDIEAGGVRLRIDAQEGEFWIEAASADDGDGWPEIFERGYTIGEPHYFLSEIAAQTPLPKYRDGAEVLFGLARRLWTGLEMAFDAAVASHRAEIWVRRPDLYAPFTRLFPDQFRFFEFGPERRDPDGALLPAEVRGPNGELAFTPMIRPVEHPRDASEEQDLRAIALLIELKAKNPQANKVELIGMVRADVPVSIERMRNVIWRETARKAPELGLSKRGPRSKKLIEWAPGN